MQASWVHRAALISVSCSPRPDTSRSRKTTDTGLVHRVVWPFTPQLSLVLINRPRRDGMLSWCWYTAATSGIRTHDLAVASKAPYHTATAYRMYTTYEIIRLLSFARWSLCVGVYRAGWQVVVLVLLTRFFPVPSRSCCRLVSPERCPTNRSWSAYTCLRQSTWILIYTPHGYSS